MVKKPRKLSGGVKMISPGIAYIPILLRHITETYEKYGEQMPKSKQKQQIKISESGRRVEAMRTFFIDYTF